MELLSTRSFEIENEVENPCRQPQKVAVYLGYFMTREMDSNPRSLVTRLQNLGYAVQITPLAA